jgi:hypothetical protein
MTVGVVFWFLLALVSVYADYPDPPQTFQAADWTKWDDVSVKESKRAMVDISFDGGDYIKLFRLDLVGDAKDRGFAQGALMAEEITEFMGPALDNFFSEMVQEIDTSGMPDWLAKVLDKTDGRFTPAAVHKALNWVWEKEAQYVPQRLVDEMDSIAEGICSVLGDKCDVEENKKLVRATNMIPELIRMSCTAFGAWGKATGGGLVQLRALDFGPGPFANYTVVSTNRANTAGEGPSDPFVSVAFPGMVGVITGVSKSGIGVSEKVWMTSGKKRDLQPGGYDGEPDVFVLRDILENASTKEDAKEYMRNAKRTWGMWVGTGDYKSQEFDLTGYRQEDAVTYNDNTMPSMTGQPYIENLCYVDKHPQPSTDDTLPTVLNYFYGKISLDTTKTIIQTHTTGDVHAAAYDFSRDQLSLTIGKIDAKGYYGANNEGMAYNRPWTLFKLSDLFNGN